MSANTPNKKNIAITVNGLPHTVGYRVIYNNNGYIGNFVVRGFSEKDCKTKRNTWFREHNIDKSCYAGSFSL